MARRKMKLRPANAARPFYGKRHGGNLRYEIVTLNSVSTDTRAFQACVASGTKTRRRGWTCAEGKNPRKALANALHKFATGHVRARRGAFAGKR